MYIMIVYYIMLAQRFESRGSRFTNLHYYYYYIWRRAFDQQVQSRCCKVLSRRQLTYVQGRCPGDTAPPWLTFCGTWQWHCRPLATARWYSTVPLSCHSKVVQYCPFNACSFWRKITSTLWTPEPFVTKVSMTMHRHEPWCHAERLVCYFMVTVTVRAHPNNITVSTLVLFKLLILSQPNLFWWYSLMIKISSKKTDFYVQGEGHSILIFSVNNPPDDIL